MPAHRARQASAEIEVTPEMIVAGLTVIYSRPSLCEDGWDELAFEVYRAMESARRLAAARRSDAQLANGA
jgi:hypothetical protein